MALVRLGSIDRYIDMSSKKNIIKESYVDIDTCKTIIFIYPEQANRSAVFVENKSKAAQIILQILKIRDLITSNDKMIFQMMFDCDKYPFLNDNKKQYERLDSLIKILNDGISPYEWSIYETYEGITAKLIQTDGDFDE